MAEDRAREVVEYRPLAATEIERVDEIDRAEVIDHVYRFSDGELVLEEEHWDLREWPPGELDANRLRMIECLARGGAAWGAFVGERLVGMAVLDGRPLGSDAGALDLYFLHVSNGYRTRGIGRALVGLARRRASELGARRLYVSATPSQNTVEFYRRVGFDPATAVDAELFDLEPEDIHMDLRL